MNLASAMNLAKEKAEEMCVLINYSSALPHLITFVSSIDNIPQQNSGE
jgi:hypothetical protein